MPSVRLAWLATHPIQYQAPLLRRVAATPGIDLKVIFFSDFSVRSYHDKEFGRAVTWDVPMLEGFDYQVLHESVNPGESFSFWHPRVPQLKELLTQDHFDVVVIQGWNHYGYPYAAWLAKRAGLKVILRCEATDHVASSTGLKRQLRETLLKLLFKKVDCFAAIGKHNRRFYLKRGVEEKRIVTMPYCVDNDHFRSKAERADTAALREELQMHDDAPVILYASKLTARKNADLLLEAYAALPEPRPWLVVVGDGELKPVLEERIREQSLKRVRMAGFRNQGELPAFYALADIFVLPSVNETWGLVVNEAMSAGCAIVVTDQVGSGADLVENGRNGYVVPPLDQDALTNALQATLVDERYRSMGELSRKRIAEWGISQNIVGLQSCIEQHTVITRTK